MVFHDVKLDTTYRYGSTVGPMFNTLVHASASGHEHRGQRQSQPRHRFRLLRELESPSAASGLKTFAIARRGSVYSFRTEDLLDKTSNADGYTTPTAGDQILGSGDGSNIFFQLIKTYDYSGPAPYPRTITLPQDGTVRVKVNGVEVFSPADWSITNPGGLITFVVAPPLGHVVTAGYSFDVPARFVTSYERWASMQASAFEQWNIADLEIIEVLDELEWPESWLPGYGKAHGAVSADLSISFAEGSCHTFAPTTAVSVYFPPIPVLFPGGDQLFTIHNVVGSAGTLQPRDDQANTIGSTLSAGQSAQYACLVDSGSNYWFRV